MIHDPTSNLETNRPAPVSGGLALLRGMASVLGSMLAVGLVVVLKLTRRFGDPTVFWFLLGAVVMLGAIAWFIAVGARILTNDAHRPTPSRRLAAMKVLFGVPLSLLCLFGLGPEYPFGLLPAAYRGAGFAIIFAAAIALGLLTASSGVAGLMGRRLPGTLRWLIPLLLVGGLTFLGPGWSGDYRSFAMANGLLPTQIVKPDRYDPQSKLAFSEDGLRLLAVSERGAIEAWNLATSRSELIQCDAEFFADFFRGADISRNLQRAAWARGMAKDATVVDVTSGEAVFSLKPDQPEEPSSVALSADGRQLAVGLGSTIQIWDVDGHSLLKSSDAAGNVGSMVFVAPDRWVYCTGGTLWLWDTTTEVAEEVGHVAGTLQSLVVSADSRLAAASEERGGIHVWDLATRQEVQHFVAHGTESTTYQMTFSPDGVSLASARGGSFTDDQLCVWQVTSGDVVYQRDFDYGLSAVAFGPDGTVATAGNHEIRLWKLSRRR